MGYKIITIIDAGIGNFQSVANMVGYLGIEVEVMSKPRNLDKLTHLILPGVGAFDAGMKKLEQSGWRSALMDIDPKTNLLGICLGMQLLTVGSEEGLLPGLSLIDASCRRFDSKQVKVPQMGWNEVKVIKSNSLIPNFDTNHFFYFSHSFFVNSNNTNIVTLESVYGSTFISGFEFNNIFGVQFHPEKSHKYGMQLLRNFANL